MTVKVSSDGAFLVDTDYVMTDATVTPPRKNVQLLCGNLHSGKTVISVWDDKFGFTHWAPVPVFPKPKKP
jgi:hypothetical protein